MLFFDQRNELKRIYFDFDVYSWPEFWQNILIYLLLLQNELVNSAQILMQKEVVYLAGQVAVLVLPDTAITAAGYTTR